MTDPTARTALGEGILNGTWWLDVNTGTAEVPTWTPVNGIFDFKDLLDAKDIDVSDFSSNGWADTQLVGKSWGVEAKVWRKRQLSSSAYDPGQEYLRSHAAGIASIRYYEMSGDGTIATGHPRVEAYSGTTTVNWSPEGGKVDDAKSVSVKLTGKGARVDITHPMPNVPSTPSSGSAALS